MLSFSKWFSLWRQFPIHSGKVKWSLRKTWTTDPGDLESSSGSTTAHMICDLGQVSWFLNFCKMGATSPHWLLPASLSSITEQKGSWTQSQALGFQVQFCPTLWPQETLSISISFNFFICKMDLIIFALTKGFCLNQMRWQCFEKGEISYRSKVVLMVWTCVGNFTRNVWVLYQKGCVIRSLEALCFKRKWVCLTFFDGAQDSALLLSCFHYPAASGTQSLGLPNPLSSYSSSHPQKGLFEKDRRKENRVKWRRQEPARFLVPQGHCPTLVNSPAAAPTFPGRPKVTVGGSAYLRNGSWKLGHES